MFPLMNVMFGINRRIPVFTRPFRAERVYFGEPRLKPIGANLFCYNIFEPGFCGTWKIPKGRVPAVANGRSPLPDSIQAPRRVEFDGE